jgi:hypothetical protein
MKSYEISVGMPGKRKQPEVGRIGKRKQSEREKKEPENPE